MSNKKLFILGVAAAVMVVLSVLQSQVANRKQSTASTGATLIQGLDVGVVGSIEVISEGKQLTLNRNGGLFVVAERESYPAQSSRINDLIISCLDINTVELITSSKSNHADLGVDTDSAKWIVKFLDVQANQLTAVVISKATLRITLRSPGFSTVIKFIRSKIRRGFAQIRPIILTENL